MSEPKVFISHSHDDADWVRRFAKALREQHVSVWLDEWEMSTGEDFDDALETGMRGSDAIVSVLTRSAPQRPNVLFDLGAALGMGKAVIPIVPAGLDSSAIPLGLRTRRYLAKGAPEDAAREVAEAVLGKST